MSDLRQLNYFITLVKYLNYSKAAKALNISQPPLSRQIASLEEKLGVKLLNRHHYGVSLTEAGKAFYTDALAIASSYELACSNARMMAVGEKGALSVGFMMHAAYSTIPELTRRVISTFPALQLKLHEVTPGTLIDAVLQGEYDVGLVFNPGPVRYLNSLTVRRERLCLAVHKNHLLAREKSIDAAKLKNEPLIASPHSVAPVLREMLDLFLRQRGVEPCYRLEAQLQQTIVSLVAEELGVALVPESVKKLQYEEIVYVEVEQSPVIEQVLIWHTGNSNPALAALIPIARMMAEKSLQ